MTKTRRPYGSWKSPLDSTRITAGAIGLGQPRFDPVDGTLYWLERRPEEGGRQVVVTRDRHGEIREVSPAATNVRTRVHEYGGGDYAVRGGRLVYVDFTDQRVHGCDVAGGDSTPLTEPGSALADFEIAPDGRFAVAVEERPRSDGQEPENRLVVFSLESPATLRVVASGHDFYASPRFSSDGSALAYIAWDHPCMPWDGTMLYRQPWRRDAPMDAPRRIAGGPSESIFQPGFSERGRLTFVSDRTEWWNLHQLRDGELENIGPSESEFGITQWVFGMSTWDFVSEAQILAIERAHGRDQLVSLDVPNRRFEPIDVGCDAIEGLRVHGRRAAFIGAAGDRDPAVMLLDLDSGRCERLRGSTPDPLDPAWISIPRAIEFSTGRAADGETAHAFLYPAHSPENEGLEDERPPLIVMAHGGPTAAASSSLDLRTQYWTTRGFSVIDVNYRGSRGYGRRYRNRLRGAWGIVDVDDCVSAARAAVTRQVADEQRLAIRGGSAGGFTTLCALTFHDVFSAGASHYGIGDLETLARDTHKFESRYLDSLVGPYPERRDIYFERSPIHFTDRLGCPVIFFQGLEDRVVPPSQAEAMVEALAKRGIPHAYVAFEGEQHGFRRAENIRTALDGELYFYSRVFGFEVEKHPESVVIRGL